MRIAPYVVMVMALPTATAQAQRLERIAPPDSFVLPIGERIPGHLRRVCDAHNVPVVSVRTSRVYSCLLDLSLSVAGSRTHARLTINGIEDVGSCPSAMGPAASGIAVDVDDGIDTLDVVAEGRIDRYLLDVTDSSLCITPVQTSYTRFDLTNLQRAPQNSMAFYCERHRMDAASDRRELEECASFIRLLADSLGVRELTFSGTGSIPFPLRSDLERNELRYFRYRQAEDFATMYDLLQRFSRSALSPSISHAFVTIVNWRGTLIDSYRCAPWQGCESMHGRPQW